MLSQKNVYETIRKNIFKKRTITICFGFEKVSEIVKQYCDANHVPVTLNQVDILQKAKDLPCVFNNWGVFYKVNFETVNLLLDVEHLKRILKK